MKVAALRLITKV